MYNLLQSIMHLFFRLFGGIQNHTKPPELDGAAPDDQVKALPPAEAEEPNNLPEPEGPSWLEPPEEDGPTTNLRPWGIVKEIVERRFEKPSGYELEFVPSSKRYDKGGVYEAYGRAPKETGNTKYPKAQLKVHTGLVGTWNKAKDDPREGKGNARLYMERSAGIHFREALLRAEEMERRISHLTGEFFPVLSYMTKVGSFSHRHIRHNPDNELSFHSWAIACDVNPPWNRGVTYASEWQKRTKKDGKTTWVPCDVFKAQRGPVNKVLPFSKQYAELYPKSMPVELVMAFKSVNFCWGGDWGRSKWHEVVAKFGSGYDQNDPTVSNSTVFKEAMKEWKSMRYLDPMHFELTIRRGWAEAHYARTKA